MLDIRTPPQNRLIDANILSEGYCSEAAPGIAHLQGVELPGDEVMVHREGNRLIIEPDLQPLDEELPTSMAPVGTLTTWARWHLFV